jgi:broad specificity phosphatase PhoE
VRLFLVRHGNTFLPHEKAVWVGVKEDLPLVPEAKNQARRLANFMRKEKLFFDRAFCSVLQRTLVFGQEICQQIGFEGALIRDVRLNEIDFGLWSALSSEQVEEKFPAELAAWKESSQWPKNAGFAPSQEQIEQQVGSFVRDLQTSQNVLVVSSNGRLRYFLSQLCGLAPQPMLTGAISSMTFRDHRWHLDFWNKRDFS